MEDDLLAVSPVTHAPRLKMILLILGGLFVVFGILALALSGSGAGSLVQKISGMSSEISRVAGLASDHDSANGTNRHIAGTMETVYASYVARLENLPGGQNVDKQTLAEYRDDSVETTLEEAQQQNAFNETFVALMILKLDELLPETAALVERVDPGIDRAVAEALYEDSQLFAQLLEPAQASSN